jgi:hypothetical protein
MTHPGGVPEEGRQSHTHKTEEITFDEKYLRRLVSPDRRTFSLVDRCPSHSARDCLRRRLHLLRVTCTFVFHGVSSH